MELNKCGLDPLVECSEICEETNNIDNDTTPGIQPIQVVVEVQQRKISDEHPKYRARATPVKSTDGTSIRPRKCGSRISLTSLLSFTGHPFSKERSRSGWSYSDEAGGHVTMTSVSTSDIRSAASGSLSSKRYRGSDTGSGVEDDSENCADLLIPKDDHENEKHHEEKKFDMKENKKEKSKNKMKECPLCAAKMPSNLFPKLKGCQHRSCKECLRQYVELSITENRVEVPCPECSSYLHPNDIKMLVGDMPGLIEKYEQFSLRRYLMTEPDARWCPAPDCGYVLIATKCAACPQLKCARDECGMLFCYHCKREWHNNQTCDEARRPEKRRSRAIGFDELMRNGPFHTSQDSTLKPGDVKACPRCKTYIVKMDDGSCNHMVCTMCNAEFCWLCLKEISDLHYLSPTGCTFWGKKPWTRKKKLLWQVGTLIGAPVGIALIAGLSIPGIIFGVPVFVGRKVHQRFKYKGTAKRRILTATCVVGSLVVSPVMAVMAVGVGVPIMLAYVYGVVPLSLCRNGGCGLSTSDSHAQLAVIDEEQLYGASSPGTTFELSHFLIEKKDEAVSTDPSMHSALSVPHDSRSFKTHTFADLSRRRTSCESGERVNYEEASVKAMSGSHHYDDKSLHTLCSGHEVTSISDEQSSTKALAGSVLDSKSLSESVHKQLVAKYAERVAIEMEEKRSVNDDNDDDLPSTSASSSNKVKPSVKTCTIENEEDVLLLSEEAAALILGASGKSSHSGNQNDSHVDLFKIRSWLDNMKQMVASDVPQEKPYEPAARCSTSKIRRSGSGKSVHTVSFPTTSKDAGPSFTTSNVSMPEAGNQKDNVSLNSTSSKRRRRLGMFTNWFTKSK